MVTFIEIIPGEIYNLQRRFQTPIKKYIDEQIMSMSEIGAIHWLCAYLNITVQKSIPYVRFIQDDNREISLYDNIVGLLKKERKIQAIKLYREYTCTSLKEAKDHVEDIQYGKIKRPEKEETIIKELPDELWEIE